MLNYRKLIFALAALLTAAAALPGPALAQFSDSYKFLDAVRKKDGNAVTALLDKGSPSLINTRDLSSGDTALHIAAMRRDLTWMQFLVAKGANVNTPNAKGETALVVAVNLGFNEGTELLIGNGAAVDARNRTGETPLITAVHNRNVGLMRLLLKAGADPDRSDNSGRSARDYAAIDPKAGMLLNEIKVNAKPKPKPGQGAKLFGPK